MYIGDGCQMIMATSVRRVSEYGMCIAIVGMR